VAERGSRTLAGSGGGSSRRLKKKIVTWSIFVTNWVAEWQGTATNASAVVIDE
jgi:hypothetical protein